MKFLSCDFHHLSKTTAPWRPLFKTRENGSWSRAVLLVAICCSFLATTVFVPSVAQAQITDENRAALVALYDSTNGDNWRDNTNWKSDRSVGTWYGIDRIRDSVVMEIDLSNNRLRGTIPPEIGDLTGLTSLNLNYNSLRGAIPAEIGNLTNLKELRIRRNSLTGEIPAEIGNLTSLTSLLLPQNSLSGAIPREMGNMASLRNLWLYENELSGAIPREMGNLTSLWELQLQSNDLSGEIPVEIGNLTRLRKLLLARNDLSGGIPGEIGNLTRLDHLWLGDNNLTGAIPSEIGNLTRVEWLWLHENDLSGEVPEEILNLTSLDWLDLSLNRELTGELPDGLRHLPIATLDIRRTCITTPATNAFETWLRGIDFTDSGIVCMPSVTVTPTALTVAEGDSMKYTMVLDAKPVSVPRIRVSLASGSDTDITVNETFLYFRPDNWNVAQEVTVFVAEDDDALNGAATIEHTVTGGLWAGSGYDGVTISSITVTEADNDIVPGVTVTPTALTVAEGDNVKYTVVLDTQPSADVTISLSFASGSDEDITVDNPSLTFTPDTWDTAQEVTISAAEDADATNGTAMIEHAASGGDYDGVTGSSVTVTEADNDAPGVAISPTALTVPEGSNAKYTVVLTSQPSDDVTVTPSLASGSDADITVDKPSLTFTTGNWSTSQEVTVSAAEDTDTANGEATIEHAVAGADYASVTASDVTVTEADNDTDTGGDTGGGGDPGTGGDPPDTIPNAPGSLRATIGSAQVTLHWDAPGNDGGAAITGYAYRYMESGGNFIAWTDIPGGANVRSYTVTGLMNERAYTFQVHAVNSVGRGASAEVAVTLPEVTSAESEEIPTEVTLQGNYPNPFNPYTTIRYALPKAGEARLAVYDLIGHEVAVLVDEPKPAGNHTVRFDAADLPSGLYVYRLQAAGKIVTRSMMLVK